MEAFQDDRERAPLTIILPPRGEKTTVNRRPSRDKQLPENVRRHTCSLKLPGIPVAEIEILNKYFSG